jgi:hypothetical protein
MLAVSKDYVTFAVHHNYYVSYFILVKCNATLMAQSTARQIFSSSTLPGWCRKSYYWFMFPLGFVIHIINRILIVSYS